MRDRKLIINADDFGWTDGQNQAVVQAHTRGILTRASLLCNGLAFEEAIEISSRLPRLGIGIHLTLNEGVPLLDARRLPHLTRLDGAFNDGLKPLVWLWATGKLSIQEAQSEWRAQIERALRAGIEPTHLDSHKHVHLFPPLLRAIIDLAREYHIRYVRLPVERTSTRSLQRGPAWLVLWTLGQQARTDLNTAELLHADSFIGFSKSGKMSKEQLANAIHTARIGTTEIMTHPAVITPAVVQLQQRYRWAARYRFEEELAALTDDELVRLRAGINDC
jgi:hopanoid biosynthesis associated protein HpnK